MKKILIAGLFLNIAHAQQSTGPVYNFNFINDVNQKNEVKATINSTAEPISKEEKDNYFSRNLLSSPDKFHKVLLTFMTPISRKGNVKRSNIFSANILLSPQLWGIKVLKEEYKDSSGGEYDFSSTDIKSWKFGANKFIPVNNFIALEAAAFYESGKFHYLDSFTPEQSFSYKSGSFNLGLNFFSGNFLAGIQYQQRFLISAPTEEGLSILKRQNLILGNVGIYF